MKGLIFFLALWVGVAYSCDENQIKQCIQVFSRAVGGADPSVLQTEQQINSACSAAFPNLNNCLKRHTKDCPVTVRMTFEGLVETFEFACDEGKEDMIEFGPCLSDSGLRGDIQKCQNTMHKEMRDNGDADKDTVCGFVGDFLDCVHDEAEEECGEDAAEFQDKLTRKVSEVMVEQVGCDLDALGAAGHVTAGWTVLSALIARMVLAYF